MDNNIVFAKTAAGEEAMRQRTRVVQRNMRMVLILIDGKATVGDLIEKIGNPDLVGQALRDLEQGGFIAPVLDADSLWEESRKVAEIVRAAAMNKISDFSSFDNRQPHPAGALRPAVEGAAATGGGGGGAISDFTKVPDGETMSTFAGAPTVFDDSPLPAPAAARTPPAPLPPSWARPAAPEPVAPAPASGRSAGGAGQFLARLFVRVVFAGIGITLLLGALAWFYPYDRHRDEIAAALTEALGIPVTVGAVSTALAPAPRLVLSDVRAGAAGELQIARLKVLPTPAGLFLKPYSFLLADLEGIRLQPPALAPLPAMLTALVRPESGLRVGRVTLSDASLGFEGMALGSFHGEVRTTPGGAPSIRLHAADRSLKVDLLPAASGFEVAFEGFAWQPDASVAWRFESLAGSGFLGAQTINLRQVEARVFGGTVKGSVLLDAAARPTLAAALSVERVDARQVAALLGVPPLASGEISGPLRLAGAALRWNELRPALEASGEVTVQRGSLLGVDLAEAVRRGAGAPVGGGETRFEQLSAQFVFSPQGLRLREIALVSGLMHAAGHLAISADHRLGGSLDVMMRGSASHLRASVQLSGVLGKPLVEGARP